MFKVLYARRMKWLVVPLHRILQVPPVLFVVPEKLELLLAGWAVLFLCRRRSRHSVDARVPLDRRGRMLDRFNPGLGGLGAGLVRPFVVDVQIPPSGHVASFLRIPIFSEVTVQMLGIFFGLIGREADATRATLLAGVQLSDGVAVSDSQLIRIEVRQIWSNRGVLRVRWCCSRVVVGSGRGGGGGVGGGGGRRRHRGERRGGTWNHSHWFQPG